MEANSMKKSKSPSITKTTPTATNSNKRTRSAVDRRKFVQTVLASVPAASLACAMPSVAHGAASTRNTADWICLVNWLFTYGGVHFYLALNCRTSDTYVYAGGPDLPLGNCGNPAATNCAKVEVWMGYKQTDDDLRIVMGPELNKQQMEKVELFRSIMLMNS
jgi:hypothetical protein